MNELHHESTVAVAPPYNITDYISDPFSVVDLTSIVSGARGGAPTYARVPLLHSTTSCPTEIQQQRPRSSLCAGRRACAVFGSVWTRHCNSMVEFARLHQLCPISEPPPRRGLQHECAFTPRPSLIGTDWMQLPLGLPQLLQPVARRVGFGWLGRSFPDRNEVAERLLGQTSIASQGWVRETSFVKREARAACRLQTSASGEERETSKLLVSGAAQDS